MGARTMIGSPLGSLSTPCFLINLSRLKSNCERMTARVSATKHLTLRAHIKTHKTVEAAILQCLARRSLVTSTLTEAEMLANANFDDLLLAYPITEHQMDRLYNLRRQLQLFHIMMGHEIEATFRLLDNYPPPANKKWSIFLAIDCGYGREGVQFDDERRLRLAADHLKERENTVHLQGVYVHCGNTYDALHTQDVIKMRNLTAERLMSVKSLLEEKHNLKVIDAGLGSTPSCSHDLVDMCNNFDGLTEVHPGNYVFYDVQQSMLGSCKREEIAVAVMTRILEIHAERNELVIDAGFTALTKQGYEQMGNTHAIIEGHPEWKLVKMSQELGIISYKDDLGSLRVGDPLFLLPYHSCATAASHPVYYVHEDSVVVDVWHPCRGW